MELNDLIKNSKFEELDNFREKCRFQYNIFLPLLNIKKVIESSVNTYYSINILDYVPKYFIVEEYKDLIELFTKIQLYIYSDYGKTN